jgi:hydrophobic/amphiphilic exporter-1 (mainly G- bacteria), HAE1 family
MIRLSIRRPVAVAMVYICVALLGVAAFQGIPLELLPDASFPRLNVSFSWGGASPETVEAFATSPVEASIQQIKGVQRITSTTREGRADISVEFNRTVDMDFVRMELSERMATLEEDLPEGVSQINVQPWVPREFEQQATLPLLSYTFTGPYLLEFLRTHLDEVVAPELMRIDGVSTVQIAGGRARVIEIELDPDGIAALGLQPQAVRAAIDQLDLLREAGTVREGEREWGVQIVTRPSTAHELRQAILPGNWRRPIRVDDVATIRDTFEEPTSYYRINASPAVTFSIRAERGANLVEVSEQVKARVAQLEALNPADSEFRLTRDLSDDVRAQLTDLRNRAAVAAVVIFLVLLGFLRSFRTAGIVFATIAFSILIAVNLIYFGGLTLNILTLMGLALGFGLIVDNSIVVLENIYRQWEQGTDPESASEKGARDVTLPILASTLTTLIVFVPFLYLQGELRIYYLPLAIVVGLTLLASIFVAFTFIPALTARLLDGGTRPPRRDAEGGERLLGSAVASAGAPAGAYGSTPGSGSGSDGGVSDRGVIPAYARAKPPIYIQFYSGLLGMTLRAPWVTVIVAAVCFAGSYHLFDNHVNRRALWGGGGVPMRSYIQIGINLPRGSDLARADQLARFFEERLERMAPVERFETTVSGTNASIRVTFPEELEFTVEPLIIEEQLSAFSLGFSGANISVRGVGQTFGTGGGGSIPNYRTTFLGYNYERLGEIAEDFGRRIANHSRVHEVDTNASAQFSRDRDTEFVVHIDRISADRHGVSVTEVANLVQANLRDTGNRGQVKLGGETVPYEVKLEGFRQADVRTLTETVVATSRGTQLPLGDLIEVTERRVLTAIRRENQQYERTVGYDFRGPARLGNLVHDEAVAATMLPPGYSIRERTAWRISQEDERQMWMVLLIAIGLVFMVTAALFESIRQPMCVLLAVPMALIGVFLIFFYTGASFTREARIGVIMMGGIVVNNAILLVDHINRVRAESGLSFQDAVIRGTLERIRPILMTTTTTVLGLLPLVLFTRAADATIWNALTFALIGGLLSSTIFVLTTTPALYLLFERIGRTEEELDAGRIRDHSPPGPGATGPPGDRAPPGVPPLQGGEPSLSV